MWLNSSKRQWSATFWLKPVAKGRAKITTRGGFPRNYTPAKTRNAEREFRALLTAENPPMLEGAVAMALTFCFVRPSSAKNRAYPTVKPDCSNLQKLIEDACNGILYRDDAQICQVSTIKRYADVESIQIYVCEMGD